MDFQELEVLFWKKKKIIEIQVSIVTALREVMSCLFIYVSKLWGGIDLADWSQFNLRR
jgi:hypothetical protein